MSVLNVVRYVCVLVSKVTMTFEGWTTPAGDETRMGSKIACGGDAGTFAGNSGTGGKYSDAGADRGDDFRDERKVADV